LIPKHGPSDGSRSAITAFLPSFPNASPSPTVIVVFPSPAGVGLMAVIITYVRHFLITIYSRATNLELTQDVLHGKDVWI